MKAITLNQKTWHYRVAKTFGAYDWPDEDFCKYVRHVIMGLFILVFMGTLAGFFAGFCLYWVGSVVYSGYTCWFTNKCTFGEGQQTAVGIITVSAALVGIGYWAAQRAEKKRDLRWAIAHGHATAPEPGFIVSAWRSLKHKTCYRLAWQEEIDRAVEIAAFNEKQATKIATSAASFAEYNGDDEEADDSDDGDNDQDENSPVRMVKTARSAPVEPQLDESEGGHAD